MLIEQFGDILPKLAIGLVGSGSECFMYDDKISTDHDFDPGFLIFVPEEFDDDIIFKINRAYAKLPREYMGYERAIMSPVGGNRRGVKKISDFLLEKTGTKDGSLSYYDFLKIPEESIAELVNGEIWRDDSKVFTNIRIKLATFPEDVKLKKLAGEILIMAQSGQYNFERCIAHNEFGAARLAAFEFVNAALHAAFLLNEVYMPYYKWKFRAFRDLYWPKNYVVKSDLNKIDGIEDETFFKIPFEQILESILTITDERLFTNAIQTDISKIANAFVERLTYEKLTSRNDKYLEPHAYEVNNKIKDNELRNMHILAGV